MSGDELQATLVTLIPLVVLWRGFRTPRERDLRRWATRFGPVLDAETRPLIAGVLRRGRRLRATGAAAGIVVSSAPAYMNLIDPARSSDFAGPVQAMAWIVGAALGTATAEISVVQRPLRTGVAALQSRRWDDYVALWPVRYVGAFVALAVVGAMLGLFTGIAQRTEVLIAAGTAVAAGALMVAGLGNIVRRPRLAIEERWRVVDDALRADGANRVVGASAAMASASAAVALGLGSADVAPAGGALVALVLHLIGLGLWWMLSRDAVWRMDTERIAP